jgi:hypothetical protein
MKRVLSLILVLTLVFSATLPVFGESNSNVKIVYDEVNKIELTEESDDSGSSTRSNRFRYYYTETDFGNSSEVITTEEQMDSAMKWAAAEVGIVFWISGKIIGRVVVNPALSNAAKSRLIDLVSI